MWCILYPKIFLLQAFILKNFKKFKLIRFITTHDVSADLAY
ncbi:hypothetical protein AO366_0707 [Moraxella catarrhalis]|nr:hypothetical protein AO366_0707 [Moraxella catarrhalis]